MKRILILLLISLAFSQATQGRAGRGGSYSSGGSSSFGGSSGYKGYSGSSSSSSKSTSSSSYSTTNNSPYYTKFWKTESAQITVELNNNLEITTGIELKLANSDDALKQYKNPKVLGIEIPYSVDNFASGIRVVSSSASGFGTNLSYSENGLINISKSSEKYVDELKLKLVTAPKDITAEQKNQLIIVNLRLADSAKKELIIRNADGFRAAVFWQEYDNPSALTIYDLSQKICDLKECTYQSNQNHSLVSVVFIGERQAESIQKLTFGEKRYSNILPVTRSHYNLDLGSSSIQYWNVNFELANTEKRFLDTSHFFLESFYHFPDHSDNSEAQAFPDIFIGKQQGDFDSRFWSGNSLDIERKSSNKKINGGYAVSGSVFQKDEQDFQWLTLLKPDRNAIHQSGIELQIQQDQDCNLDNLRLQTYVKVSGSEYSALSGNYLNIGNLLPEKFQNLSSESSALKINFPIYVSENVNLAFALPDTCTGNFYSALSKYFFAIQSIIHSPGGYHFLTVAKYPGPIILIFLTSLIFYGVTSSRKKKKLAEENLIVEFTNKIHKQDTAFDWSGFVQLATLIAEKLQTAWSGNQMESVRSYLSQGMVRRLDLQIKMMVQNEKLRNRITDFRVLKFLPAGEPVTKDGYQTVHMRMFAQIRSKDLPASLDESSALKAVKSARLEKFTEIYSFTRKSSAKTRSGQGVLNGTCPACGAAARRLSESNKCESCGSLFASGEYDWVLTEITQESEWSSANEQKKPQVPSGTQKLEDRASYLFWNYLAARDGISSHALLRNSVPKFYQEIQGLPPEPVYIPVVGKSDTTSSAFAKSGRLFAWVKIRYSAADAPGKRPENHDAVLALGLDQEFHNGIAHGFADLGCQNCGGPLPQTDSSKCQYCGSDIPEKMPDWLLYEVKIS
ncbi:MAG: Tim44 domain-containing protein [Leptospiraceae bacterium]|nr:Tim44 domain-containing protein [Leptospiraceae bacterium]MCB1199019.1 Tim44 domain-containing protein [Leptospiraceae bacterium]